MENKELHRLWYRKHHPLAQKVCKVCGFKFSPTKSNRQKFCSKKCRIKSLNKYRQIGFKSYKLICHNCQQEFMGKKGQKFCSEDCRFHYSTYRQYKKKHHAPRRCLNCGKDFSPYNLRQKYCSRECLHRRNIDRNKKIFPAKVCLVCGATFTPIFKHQRYCSVNCRLRIKNARKNRRSSNSFYVKSIAHCEVCGFSLIESLEAHHYSPKDRIVLCGNCHNIYHRISKEKYCEKVKVAEIVLKRLVEHQMSISGLSDAENVASTPQNAK